MSTSGTSRSCSGRPTAGTCSTCRTRTATDYHLFDIPIDNRSDIGTEPPTRAHGGAPLPPRGERETCARRDEPIESEPLRHIPARSRYGRAPSSSQESGQRRRVDRGRAVQRARATAANDDGSIDLLCGTARHRHGGGSSRGRRKTPSEPSALLQRRRNVSSTAVDSRTRTPRASCGWTARPAYGPRRGRPSLTCRYSIYARTGEGPGGRDNARSLQWVIVDDRVRADFETLRSTDRGSLLHSGRRGQHVDRRVRQGPAPNPYYVYDRRSRKATFSSTPRGSQEVRSVPMEPMSYAGRATASPYMATSRTPWAIVRTNLPLVLFVHGGPWTGLMTYHPRSSGSQNRGYVCLQVTSAVRWVRKAFLNAGKQGWGGAMQNVSDRRPFDGRSIGDRQSRSALPSMEDRTAIRGALRGAFHPGSLPLRRGLVGSDESRLMDQFRSPSWIPTAREPLPAHRQPETEGRILRSRSPYSASSASRPDPHRAGREDPACRIRQRRLRRGLRAGVFRSSTSCIPTRTRILASGEPARVLRGGRAISRREARRASEEVPAVDARRG